MDKIAVGDLFGIKSAFVSESASSFVVWLFSFFFRTRPSIIVIGSLECARVIDSRRRSIERKKIATISIIIVIIAV